MGRLIPGVIDALRRGRIGIWKCGNLIDEHLQNLIVFLDRVMGAQRITFSVHSFSLPWIRREGHLIDLRTPPLFPIYNFIYVNPVLRISLKETRWLDKVYDLHG